MKHTVPASGADEARPVTLLDRALAALPPDNPARTHFSFAVIGDSRSWDHMSQPAIFREMIREANLLRASFIIHLGDLIGGYTFDRDLLERQWNEFEALVRESEAPVIPLVGNHEVTAPMHEEVYQRRAGRLYFSLDFGNAHFVCLDTEQVGQAGKIGPEQMAWLRADLEAARCEHVFVCLHYPVWHQPEVWEPVHELLAAHKVEAVISGHRHGFEAFPARDGVRYFITAGGGSGFGRAPERGGFHHFLWVAVAGARVHYALVKPGAVVPVTIVSDPEEAALPRLETEFDPREVNILAKAMTRVFLSPEGPVAGAAELARNSEGNLRNVAFALLARLAETELAPQIPSLTDDPDTEIGEAALEALMDSEHPTARRIAESLVNAEDREVARRAARALAQVDRTFPPRLREMIGDARRAAELTERTIGGLVDTTKTHLLERMCDAAMQAFPEPDQREATLWIRFHRARAVARAERYREAIEILEEVPSLAPAPDFANGLVPQSLLLQARCLAALGQREEALAVCERLRDEFATHPAAIEAADLAKDLQA